MGWCDLYSDAQTINYFLRKVNLTYKTIEIILRYMLLLITSNIKYIISNATEYQPSLFLKKKLLLKLEKLIEMIIILSFCLRTAVSINYALKVVCWVV